MGGKFTVGCSPQIFGSVEPEQVRRRRWVQILTPILAIVTVSICRFRIRIRTSNLNRWPTVTAEFRRVAALVQRILNGR